MIYDVRLTAQTREAIYAQARYIAEDCGAPRNAAKWLDRIMEAIESLEKFPRRCALAAENDHRPYEIRKINVGGYLVLFTVDDDARTVTMIGFRHGRQRESPDALPDHAPKTTPATDS